MKLVGFLFLTVISLQAMASGTYLPPPQIPPEEVECEEGEKCDERQMTQMGDIQ